jgi:FkbM family methyltransferase
MARLAALLAPPVTVPEQTPFLQRRRLRDLVDRARNRATPAVARRRDRFLFRALAAASTLYLDMFANVCFELEVNGELRVLEALAQLQPQPRCIFDVGANVGDWSIAAAAVFQHARIEAFEIVPETASVMASRLARAHVTSVRLNPIGLSDRNGRISVAHLPSFSQGSSAAVVQPVGDVDWQECAVRNGDDFCREHGIEHIDFLKIDVEGLEAQVLKGFDGMLTGARIDVIQFEYGHLNASVRFLLGDFYDLFASYGYVIGKVFPDLVEFHDYDPWRDEDFRGPNYLAVHRAQVDVLRCLGRPD